MEGSLFTLVPPIYQRLVEQWDWHWDDALIKSVELDDATFRVLWLVTIIAHNRTITRYQLANRMIAKIKAAGKELDGSVIDFLCDDSQPFMDVYADNIPTDLLRVMGS